MGCHECFVGDPVFVGDQGGVVPVCQGVVSGLAHGHLGQLVLDALIQAMAILDYHCEAVSVACKFYQVLELVVVLVNGPAAWMVCCGL